MKTQLSTAWALGLAMLTAGLPIGLAQNAPPSEPSSAGGVSAATAPAKTASEPTRAFPNAATATPRLSPWASEVVKLAQAGIEEGVVLSFIDNSGTFNLGADQIIHLSDLGVSSQMITAMLQHDLEVTLGLRPLATLGVPASGPAIRMTLVASTDRSSQASAPPAIAPAPSALAKGDFAGVVAGESVPEAGLVSARCEPARFEPTLVEVFEPGRPSPPIQQNPAPEAKGRLYPVREPYPVELAPPILIVNAAGRTPNLVVIEMFPGAAR